MYKKKCEDLSQHSLDLKCLVECGLRLAFPSAKQMKFFLSHLPIFKQGQMKMCFLIHYNNFLTRLDKIMSYIYITFISLIDLQENFL